jgi:biotin transporter BioY
VATLGMTVLGLLWLPVVPKLSSQLYIYLQSVQGYIAAPITCVFVVGVLWRGANSTGAVACLTIGSLLGLLRLIAEITLGRHYEVGIPVLRLLYSLFVGSNFLHFTCALFITCVGIIVAASHLAPLPHHNLPTIDTGPSPLPPLWPLLRRSFAGDEADDDAGLSSKPFSSRSRMAGYVGMSVVVVLSIAIIQVVFR